MERRSFLKAVGGVTGSLALGVQPALSADKSSSKREVEKVAGLPRRVLGRTGEKVSIVGFPGLALTHYEQDVTMSRPRTARTATARKKWASGCKASTAAKSS